MHKSRKILAYNIRKEAFIVIKWQKYPKQLNKTVDRDNIENIFCKNETKLKSYNINWYKLWDAGSDRHGSEH